MDNPQIRRPTSKHVPSKIRSGRLEANKHNTTDGTIFRPVLNVVENLKFCHHIITQIIPEIVY